MKKKNSDISFGVIGLGRFGSALVKTLAEAGKEVIAIDKDEQRVKAVRKYTDFAFVVDNLNQEPLRRPASRTAAPSPSASAKPWT